MDKIKMLDDLRASLYSWSVVRNSSAELAELAELAAFEQARLLALITQLETFALSDSVQPYPYEA